MPRSYRHIKEYEKEILEMRENGREREEGEKRETKKFLPFSQTCLCPMTVTCW